MMHRFKLRKQGAVVSSQHGAAKRAGDLSHEGTTFLPGKQANSHRATVTGFRCPPKCRRSGTPPENTQSPDNTDLPQPCAGAGQFQGAQAADTKNRNSPVPKNSAIHCARKEPFIVTPRDEVRVQPANHPLARWVRRGPYRNRQRQKCWHPAEIGRRKVAEEE